MDSLKTDTQTILKREEDQNDDDDWGDVPVEEINAKKMSSFVEQCMIAPNRTASSSSVIDEGDWDTDFDGEYLFCTK